MSLEHLRSDMKILANPKKAKHLSGFFKTGKGQYGEGDVFLGLTVPQTRSIAKKYSALSLTDLYSLLSSKIHEERLCSLHILTNQFKLADERKKKEIYDFYIKNAKLVNNWDLVDTSADKIVGAYLEGKDKSILIKLASSDNLWERRISIVSTFHFIRLKEFSHTFTISEMLIKDEHDLIHKASGWMLREAGKRDVKSLQSFLAKHYKSMPRTMLRYAIEKFEEKTRKAYLKGDI